MLTRQRCDVGRAAFDVVDRQLRPGGEQHTATAASARCVQGGRGGGGGGGRGRAGASPQTRLPCTLPAPFTSLPSRHFATLDYISAYKTHSTQTHKHTTALFALAHYAHTHLRTLLHTVQSNSSVALLPKVVFCFCASRNLFRASAHRIVLCFCASRNWFRASAHRIVLCFVLLETGFVRALTELSSVLCFSKLVSCERSQNCPLFCPSRNWFPASAHRIVLPHTNSDSRSSLHRERDSDAEL